jgi:hypothetical protein
MVCGLLCFVVWFGLFFLCSPKQTHPNLELEDVLWDGLVAIPHGSLFFLCLGLFFVFAGNPAHLNFGKGLGKVGFYSGMPVYTL